MVTHGWREYLLAGGEKSDKDSTFLTTFQDATLYKRIQILNASLPEKFGPILLNAHIFALCDKLNYLTVLPISSAPSLMVEAAATPEQTSSTRARDFIFRPEF